jgi:DNA-directed RNA polymerase specialized sigma24 family protein
LALQTARAVPEGDRIAFLVGAGFGQAEVAEMLHLNPTTVRTALHRFRKKGPRNGED